MSNLVSQEKSEEGDVKMRIIELFTTMCVATAFISLAHAEEPNVDPCLEIIEGNLVNPETLQLFDVDPMTPTALDAVYENAKGEEAAIVTLIKWSCVETFSMECIDAVDKWGAPIEKHRSVIEGIDSLREGSSNIEIYKLRTKAESKVGLKVTTFSLCAIGAGNAFVMNLDN